MHFEGDCDKGYICSTALMLSPVDMKMKCKTFKSTMCFAFIYRFFCYFTWL